MELKNNHITNIDEQITQLSYNVLDSKKSIQRLKDLVNTDSRREEHEDIKQLIERETYYCLFLSAQIDITICIKHLVSNLCLWEKSFFMNIAYLKIHEIKNKIRHLINNRVNFLNKEYQKAIEVKLNIFDEEHLTYIRTRRNSAGGHYDLEYTKYIENDPEIQQKIICDFLYLLEFVENATRGNSTNLSVDSLQNPHAPS